MIGIVTSAVREITTNIMLTRKLKAIAANSAASQNRFVRRNVMTGKASATAHSVNSWLWSI